MHHLHIHAYFACITCMSNVSKIYLDLNIRRINCNRKFVIPLLCSLMRLFEYVYVMFMYPYVVHHALAVSSPIICVLMLSYVGG